MVTTHHLILLTGSYVSFVPSKTLKIFFIYLMYMHVHMFTCVHVFVHMSIPQCTHGGQRSICGSWFLLSTMLVQGLKSSRQVWWTEEYLWELILSFYHVGSGAEVQPSGLGQALSLAGSLYTLPSQTVLHI